MTLQFRPALRENVGIFIGLAGESGSGKTWSAMALAKGIVGPSNRFAVIDTENKRARHYADDFAFDVLDLGAPYSSVRYEESVKAAVSKGYRAIVVDSATHEHDGEGGYLDAQHADLDERVKRYMEKYRDAKEWEVREKLTPSSWMEPKRQRKRMMYTLLSCSSTTPIIFCFRAEEKVFGTKDGKLITYNPPRWQPICGKGMPFEMTVSFMLHADKPGYPNPIKLPTRLKHLFPLDQPISEESGKRLAEWAAGGRPNTQGGLERPQREPHKLHEAGSTPAPATNQPPTESPSGLGDQSPPPPADERSALLKQIRRYADRLSLKPKERQDAWKTYVGNVKPEHADVAALNDLLSWLKARAGE